MRQEQSFETIDAAAVRETAAGMKADGYRIVQICAIPEDGGAELIYSFDRGLSLRNLKVHVTSDAAVDSITGSYWSAFVYENEIHDLFGVTFRDMAQDYKGGFFRTGTKTPWRNPDPKEAE